MTPARASGILPPLPEKRSYVRRMFAAIAPHYDRMNHLMSLGLDRAWRRTAVRLCQVPAGGRLLDVATGTGDMAWEALRLDSTLHVTGLDLTREMMVYGRSKFPGQSFSLVEGDALALPFRADTFDAVCSAFMMRNVTDIRAAFAEQARVVRPGGRVVCLELTMPQRPLFEWLFRLYFFHVVPALGELVSGQRAAYTYLPESVAAFPRPAELQGIMEEAGLRAVRYRLAMLGTVAWHWGIK